MFWHVYGLFSIIITLSNFSPVESTPSNENCIVVLKSYGTPYENGYCIGKQFSSQIADIFSGYDYYVNRSVPWSGTVLGSTRFTQFKDTLQLVLDERFEEELQGLADGSGRTFNEILLLNMEAEVRALEGDAPLTVFNEENYTMYSGSSDFYFNTQDAKTFFVHQHDLDSVFYKKIFILDATYVRPVTEVEIESFISVMVPGMLPGMMFSTNRNTYTYSGNPMFPKSYFGGLALACPQSVLLRSILNNTFVSDSNDYLNFLNLLKANPPVGPSVAIWVNGTLSAYEVLMNNTGLQQIGTYVVNTSDSYYFHFNEYQHIQPPLSTTDKYVTVSSLYRTMKIGNWINNNGALADKTAVLQLISNQDYPEYPIYDDPKDGKRIGTMFTSVVYTSGNSDMLEIYLGKPSTTHAQYKLNLTEYWSNSDYIP